MKKGILFVCVSALLVLMSVSCGGGKIKTDKLDGKWNITNVGGESINITEETPFLAFNIAEKTVNGNVGCNIYNSTITLDDTDPSAISINSGQVTMMSCPDLQTEQKILQALEKVKSVKAGKSANELLLCDATGNTVLTLTAAK